jgi:hypothetical protein
MTSNARPGGIEPPTDCFTTAVQIVVCADCALVLANGTDGWGLDESGRELGEVHAARMRDADASVGCLDGVAEGADACPDHGEWFSAAACALCGADRFGRRLWAVEFWVCPAAVERFLAGYVECALWASTDEDGERALPVG